jgi:hypothetical protein
MSVRGGSAFYETKVLSLELSWNQDIDTRPIYVSTYRITQRQEKTCVKCV